MGYGDGRQQICSGHRVYKLSVPMSLDICVPFLALSVVSACNERPPIALFFHTLAFCSDAFAS